MFTIDDESYHNMTINMYIVIKDNRNIPDEIKQSWLELCVVTANIYDLCNF